MNCGQGAFFCFRQFENLRERRAVVQYAHSIILLHGKTVQYRFTFHDDSAMHGAALGYLHRAVGVQKDSSAASASCMSSSIVTG